MENTVMLHLFEKMDFDGTKSGMAGVHELRMSFKNAPTPAHYCSVSEIALRFCHFERKGEILNCLWLS